MKRKVWIHYCRECDQKRVRLFAGQSKCVACGQIMDPLGQLKDEIDPHRVAHKILVDSLQKKAVH